MKFVTLDKLSVFKTKLLESINLSTFIRASDAGSAVDPNPINADTLGGKSAASYALKTELDTYALKTDVRNVIISTSEPTSSDGNNGDIWIKYIEG